MLNEISVNVDGVRFTEIILDEFDDILELSLIFEQSKFDVIQRGFRHESIHARKGVELFSCGGMSIIVTFGGR